MIEKLKKYKKISKIINIVICILVGAIIFFIIYFPLKHAKNQYDKKIDPSTIEIKLENITKEFQYFYGNNNFSGISIEYKRNSGEKKTISGKEIKKYLINYDENKLKVKQEVKICYENKEETIFITILPLKLEIPKINIESKTILWNKVNNAEEYLIHEVNVLTFEENLYKVKKTEFQIPPSNDDFGEYEYFVQSISNKEYFENSLISNKIKVKKLDKIAEIKYENGKIQWKKSDFTDKYEIHINNSIFKIEGKNYYQFNPLKTKTIIKIKPISSSSSIIDGKFTSLEINLLESIKEINHDLKNKEIFWEINPLSSETIIQYSKFSDVENKKLENPTEIETQGTKFSLHMFTPGLYEFKISYKSAFKNYFDSIPLIFYVFIGEKIKLENNFLSIPKHSKFEYNLVLNKQLNEIKIVDNLDLRKIKIDSGNNNLYLLPIFKEFKNFINFYEPIDFIKLNKPYIYRENEKILIKDKLSTNIVFYKKSNEEGKIFNSSLDDIKESGIYLFYSKNFSSSNNQVDSDLSNEIVLKKLEKPKISVNNLTIKVLGKNHNLQYYLDGEIFDGDINKLKIPKKYFLSAKNLAVDINEIDSEISEIVQVIKLESPIISLVDKKIVIKDNDYNDIEYYLGENIFNGEYDSVPSGYNFIKVKRKGKENIIESDFSNIINLYKEDIEVVFKEKTYFEDMYKLDINVKNKSISYDIFVECYNNDSIVKVINYQDTKIPYLPISKKIGDENIEYDSLKVTIIVKSKKNDFNDYIYIKNIKIEKGENTLI